VVGFINDHRAMYGVEPICRVVPIAPSTYFRYRARQRDPTRRPARALRDEVLKAFIQRIWTEQQQVYGSRRCGSKWAGKACAKRAVACDV
jgi:putative transposase